MKNLKHFFALAGSIIMISQSSFAQKDSSGIYKTAQDFQQKKLSYAINYITEKHKITDDMLFSEGKIKVNHEGTVYTLNKNDTYGYKSTKGEVFRFVGDKEYKVLNPGESLMIYAVSRVASESKGTFRHNVSYYFSPDATAVPQELTKENLKASFGNNHKFHDALDADFQTESLTAYDKFHKIYKLNRIYNSSLK